MVVSSKFFIAMVISLLCISFASSAKISAVIFDCDGVLIETEHFKYQAWRETLLKYKVDLSLDNYLPYVGTSNVSTAEKLKAEYNLRVPGHKLINQMKSKYEHLQRVGVNSMPDAVSFLKYLVANKHKHNIKVGLASAASRQEILENLHHINLDPSVFDAIVSGSDDLKHIKDPTGTNKPKPYIYYTIAQHLNVEPSDCVVFEDSHTGMSAAVDAGMLVLAAPNQYTKTHDFTRAKDIIRFAGLTFKDLEAYHHGTHSRLSFNSKYDKGYVIN